MPIAYGYGRQSHRDQIDANEGIPNQGNRTRAHWEAYLKPNGIDRFEFIPDESAISARKNPFMARLAGKQLMSLIQPGDHFIIDKIDRLWRSMEDFVDVMRMFKEKGVTLHICNLMGASVTLGTPMGDMFMNIAVAFAQLESDQVSDRTKAVFKARRQAGTFPGISWIPLGLKLVGKVVRVKKKIVSDTRLLVWDTEYRKYMGEIVRLADEENKACIDIAYLIRAKKDNHFRNLMGEKFYEDVIRRNGCKRWDSFCISRHYWREKQYRALPPFDPNTIRYSVFHPPGKFPFRDIGRNEPKTPNPFPFLDGRPIPTVEELRKIAG